MAALATVLCIGALGIGASGAQPVAPPLPLGVAPPPDVHSESGWPRETARLNPPGSSVADDFGKRRIYLDAGHGAAGNTGNRSAWCEDEQDFTLALAKEVAGHLESSGHFDVRVSRAAGTQVAYQQRVRDAEQWHAHAFVSLHSDVRGEAHSWEPRAGLSCKRSRLAPGFSVLWSDDGDDAIDAERLRLARATASALERLGLPAYDGADYRGLYEQDVEQTGVFVDRHEPSERIFVLHKPAMPSIIVETHNALDDREAKRWREPEVREGFAQALAEALVAALGRPSVL